MQPTGATLNASLPIVKRGLSIRQRLPLLMCMLLLIVILISAFASYYYIRNAAIETGRERLTSLTSQLGSMLSQSTANMVAVVKKTADNDTLRRFVKQGEVMLRESTLASLKKLRTDSTVALVELLDTKLTPVLQYSESPVKLRERLHEITEEQRTLLPHIDNVGKMYTLNGSIYFPVITQVTDHKEPAGYLVSWRLLVSNPKSIEALNQLMGKGTTLYIGNEDKSLWTNMVRPVSEPFTRIEKQDKFMKYMNHDGEAVQASMQAIGSSSWQVLIEMKTSSMLEGANRFLKQAMLIGTLLLLAGILLAWLVSNNITRPLDQLTKASIAISNGTYTEPVRTKRTDELGELANAFNRMNLQIMTNKAELENKVKERTQQLEILNKELEGFSYSVSHDLRAPLRAIAGYSSMLEEELGMARTEEQARLLNVIKKNSLKMGELIDDLLSFSRLGRHDLVKKEVATRELVEEIIETLATDGRKIQWITGELLPVRGDVNMIKQVWINLLSNAVKYTGRKEHAVIETGSFLKNRQTIFFVKDNGAGFDTKYKDKLFKVFQRLHSAEEFEGSGVGLAIVEKVVTKHGGRVWAESEPGKGACFYFSLPA